MKTRFTLAAICLMALVFLSTTPQQIFAKGPQKADFTIVTHERGYLWTGDIEGSWKMSGIVSDSGVLWGFLAADPQIWLFGEFGTLWILIEDGTFVVVEGTELYEEWTGAAGVWDLQGHGNRHGDLYVNYKRKLEGFLLP